MALKLSHFRAALLAGVSAVAVGSAAHAAPKVLFSSGSGVAKGQLAPGQQVTSQAGVTQVQLDNGAVVSFVGAASFSLGADGNLQVQSGNLTLGGGSGPTVIGLPNGGGVTTTSGASAAFNVTPAGGLLGQVIGGQGTFTTAGGAQTFGGTQFFRASAGGAPTQTFAGLAPQATPGLGGGINISGYNAILNAAVQQNPALVTFPIGQSQSQIASYLVSLGQTIGQLYTSGQLLQLARQFGTGAPTTPTPTTPTPTTPTPTTPTPTTPTPTTPTPTTPTPTTPTPTTPTPTTPTPTTPTPTTPTPTTPTPTTPTPTTPTPTTPTPTTPTPTTPTPTTPTPTTPTPTTPTATNTAGLVDGQTYPAGALGYNVDKQGAGTGDAGSFVVRLDASGNPNRFGPVTVTTATLAEVQSAPGWTLGRYSNGVVERNNGSTTSSTAFGPNNGMNFFVVTPVSGALPTSGVALYDSIASTTPVIYSGATAPSGSFTARLGISFGTTRQMGFDGVLTLPQGTGTAAYNFTTAGGATAPGVGLVYGSGLNVYFDGRAPVTTTGSLCGDCLVYLRGGLGGADGRFAGAIFDLYNVTSGESKAGGAVIFGRTSVTTPTPTTPTPTVTGTERTGQIIAYAGDTIGIDIRSQVTTTAEANGQINKYVWNQNPTNESPERGTNTASEVGSAGGVIIWTRWSGGVTAGTYYGNAQTTRTSNQGLHLVSGTKATALPTSGLATYTLAGATNPTLASGASAPGSFTGSMAVGFATQTRVGLDLHATVGGYTYDMSTPGGVTTPGSSPIILDTSAMTFTSNPSGNIDVPLGGICLSTCKATIDGFLAGPGASHAGLSYIISSNGGQSSNQVSGAAAFTRTAYDSTPGAGFPPAPPAENTGSLSGPLTLVNGTSGTRGTMLFSPVLNGLYRADIDPFVTSRIVTDGTGLLTGFSSNGNGAGVWTRNNAVTGEKAGTRDLQIGRWNGGDIQRDGATALSPSGYGGGVYLVGTSLQTANLPRSITATYSLFGATKPVFGNGAYAPGALTGTAAILFAANGSWKMGLSAQIATTEANGAVTYNISTPGGAGDPSQSAISSSTVSYTIPVPTGSSVCATTCTVVIADAILAGPEARDAGLAYRVGNNSNAFANGNAIIGSAIFQRNDKPVLLRQDIGGNAVASSAGSTRSHYSNTVTYASVGGPVESVSSTNGVTGIGTAQAINTGQQAGLSWARWVNGTVESHSSGATGTETVSGNQAVHVLYGDPASNIPTAGTATFALAGYTAPTIDNGSVAPGTFAGSLAIQFGSNSNLTRVGFDLDVVIGGRTYDLTSTGGMANISQSQFRLISGNFGSYAAQSNPLTLTTGGPACPNSTCRADVGGFVVGNGVTGAGLEYRIFDAQGASPGTAVRGTAAFSKQ